MTSRTTRWWFQLYTGVHHTYDTSDYKMMVPASYRSTPYIWHIKLQDDGSGFIPDSIIHMAHQAIRWWFRLHTGFHHTYGTSSYKMMVSASYRIPSYKWHLGQQDDGSSFIPASTIHMTPLTTKWWFRLHTGVHHTYGTSSYKMMVPASYRIPSYKWHLGQQDDGSSFIPASTIHRTPLTTKWWFRLHTGVHHTYHTSDFKMMIPASYRIPSYKWHLGQQDDGSSFIPASTIHMTPLTTKWRFRLHTGVHHTYGTSRYKMMVPASYRSTSYIWHIKLQDDGSGFIPDSIIHMAHQAIRWWFRLHTGFHHTYDTSDYKMMVPASYRSTPYIWHIKLQDDGFGFIPDSIIHMAHHATRWWFRLHTGFHHTYGTSSYKMMVSASYRIPSYIWHLWLQNDGSGFIPEYTIHMAHQATRWWFRLHTGFHHTYGTSSYKMMVSASYRIPSYIWHIKL